VNIPTLATILHAAGGKSPIVTLQNAGRGTRRLGRQGEIIKDEFDIIDIADRHCGCRELRSDGVVRYAHRVCRWFDMHTRARLSSYKKCGYNVVAQR
jgi:superfamily II DNA or RNA helicase